jgi:membrane protease YdiL (CAAX protease family)
MPSKLTSKEFKIIGVVVLISAASLAIGVKYFWRAFPEAAIQFRVTRRGSLPIAEQFLRARGAQLAGYRHAAIFSFDDQAKVYLERTEGLEKMNSLTQGPVHLWRWSHRWFKPQQKEEYGVEVTPAGQVVGFDHEIPEDAPGANLSQAQAQVLAEQFLTQVMHRDLPGLEFMGVESRKRPARTDHTFTWKEKDVELGDGSYRLSVEVDGGEVADYSEFVKVPEQWSRGYEKLRSRNSAAQLVDEVFWVLLTLMMIGLLIQHMRDRDVPLRLALGFGLVGTTLYFFGRLNNFSLVQFGYQTTDPYSSFMATYLLGSLLLAFGVGVWIFFLTASSEPTYREGFPRLLSFRRYLSWDGLRTRSFFMANVVGIGLTFFFFAYQTVFYLAANKLGAWAPAEVNYSDLLNTRFPWIWVLFIGFLPAVAEEMQFRAFAIPFLRKTFRSLPAALVVAAFMWGFLHSAYPNQPFFIRGLEVGVGGIIVGVMMLRFGIVATLIWHYSVDALYTAFLLLRSHNDYLMISGAVTAGIMLVPLAVALVAYLRAGKFTDEEPLTNRSEGISRSAAEAAAEAPAALPAYQPLSRRRLVIAGLLTAGLAALALVPVQRFGEGLKVRVGRAQAVQTAERYLADHHVDSSQFRQVAWIHGNVDSLALRYLLEHRTLAESDRIYRQASDPVLWQVRFFRPLEKEEHLVFVDPQTGKVFAYRHLLDEDAPGASLTPEQAQALGKQALERHGYKLGDFELQNSEAKKQKAREDYTLTWQAKPGDSRNVGEAKYRLEVGIAGDQVVSFLRHFKLPETWERRQAATGLAKVLLIVDLILVAGGLGAGFLILLVKRVKSGAIRWRRAAWVGAAMGALVVLMEIAALPALARQYPSSIPWRMFWLFVTVSFVVLPILMAAAAWLLVALATSLYPDAWQVLRGPARRLWRRDAGVAVVVCLAAGAGISRLAELLAVRFHAYGLVDVSLIPESLNTLAPGVTVWLSALRSAVLGAAFVSVLVYIVRRGVERRAWWLWLGAALLVAGLGPNDAHSLGEYLVGWVIKFVALAATVGIVAAFFRSNVLAYVAAGFSVPLAQPLVQMLSEPLGFLRWNGVLLAVLAVAVLAWLFTGQRAPGNAAPHPAAN